MGNTIILGIQFSDGTASESVQTALRGGLTVVPSAPVLVAMADDPALGAAVTQADLAITDSGLMVFLWWLMRGQKLERVSGLEYLRLLLEKLRKPEPGDLKPESFETNTVLRPQVSGLSTPPQVSHVASDGVFWVMPTKAARDRNLTWLKSQGFSTSEDDCYLAPQYPATGQLTDEQLVSILQQRKPAHIIIALGGGVQERLGFYLRQNLTKPEPGDLKPEGFGPNSGLRSQISDLSGAPQVSGFKSQVCCPGYRPGIHCIGAAIGFLSGDQVRIPVWVDYLYLGWLWRSVSAPRRFAPRYWRALRLIPLMLRYGVEASNKQT